MRVKRLSAIVNFAALFHFHQLDGFVAGAIYHCGPCVAQSIGLPQYRDALPLEFGKPGGKIGHAQADMVHQMAAARRQRRLGLAGVPGQCDITEPAVLDSVIEPGDVVVNFDVDLVDLGFLDAAVALMPGYSWAAGSRAETLRMRGRLAEALAEFDRAIALDPGYAWAIARRGQTRRQLNQLDEALADLNQAIAMPTP